MIKNRNSFFIRLAKHDSLQNNLLAIIFAKNPNIDISKRESFFDNLSRFYSILKLDERLQLEESVDSNSTMIDSWLNSDLRIKNIRLQSLRGFPKNNIPYGIDFADNNGNISSMVILGGNATGKSSLYDAIEFSYCKRVGEAELRSYDYFNDNDDKFKNFLRHFNNSFSDSSCEIDTNLKKFILDKENIPKIIREKINPNTHFISDFDIYEFGKLDYQSKGDYTFQNLIAKNVGLSEYLEIEKYLYQFTSYKRLIESNNVNKLNKEINTAKTTVENNKRAILEKQEQVKVLQENSNAPTNNSGIKILIDLVEQFKRKSLQYSFEYSNFKVEVDNFKQYYAQYSTLAVNSGSLQEIQFLEMGMSLLEKHDNCPFCNNSKSSKDEINQYVKSKIEEIKSLNELSKKLNASTNNITEYFKQLYSGLISIRAKNNEELKQIQDKTDFNDLSRIATALDGIIGNSMSNDFSGDILDIENNSNFLKDKIGFIDFILSRNEDFINEDLLKYTNSISRYEGKRKEILSKIESELNAKITTTSTEGQIAIFKNEIENLIRQNTQFNNELKIKEPELLKAIAIQELYIKVKNEATEYYKVLKTELAKETQEAFEPIKDIVVTILGEYLYEEDSPVDLLIETKPDETDLDTGEVISEIIVAYLKERNTNNLPISVNKYLNTFHFRLFCTMVGISIAVASRKNTGINLPLVLDDVFYASDFEHRATIERFIKRLFDLFKKHTPDIPLQLILFTHDQMIFESAISATYENEISNIQFAKLFPYKDSNEIKGYKNLINNIPAHLPHRIMQNQLI
jgi:hypothetical protein